MAKKHPLKRLPSKRSEGNKFDKIVKENLERLLPVMMNSIMKLKVDRMENPPQLKTQTTKEVEADFGKIIYNDEHPTGCFLHVEFEAKDAAWTDARMLQYVAMEHNRYRITVLLHLIYLPAGRPKNIKGEVNFAGVNFKYPVHCISDHSYREFISSNSPEEVLLAVLADPEGKQPGEMIRLILERLHLLKGDSSKFWKFVNQLKILSMLRNLRKETENQVKHMVISKDIAKQIKEDEMFQLGTKEGREEGQHKQAIIGIINMDAKGFDKKMVAEVLELELAFVEQVLAQYGKKEDIISELKKRAADVEKIAAQLKVFPLLVEVVKEDMS